jgi:hypothetical protein
MGLSADAAPDRAAPRITVMRIVLARFDCLKPRCAVLLASLLSGAAVGDEVSKVYEDPAFEGTVAKILVVGVHEDTGVRGQFENTLSRALRAAGASAEASLYTVSSSRELTADSLVAAAGRVRADAVLVTRVVDVQTQNPDATTDFTEYFRAYSRYEDPLPVTTTHTVRVRTDLYVVESRARIWGVESTAFEKPNLFGVIDGIAKAVTAQLRADGLIE